MTDTSGPQVPKCPDDGAWLAVIPTPRGTAYLCYSCGRAFSASAKDGSLVPDPDYAEIPKWLVDTVSRITAGSSGAAEAAERVVTDLQGLAGKGDAAMRGAIARATDVAEAAARQARDASTATQLVWGRIAEMQKLVDGAGVDGLRVDIEALRLDITELRRQLHEHVDRH